MHAWILSFCLGIFLGGFIPYLPGPGIATLFLIPLFISLRFQYLRLAAAFSLGIFWLLCWAIFHQNSIIPARLEQQDLWVQGQVSGLPMSALDSTRFILDAKIVCDTTKVIDCLTNAGSNGKVRLLLNDYSSRVYMPGQQWLLQVRLKRPHGFANPGAFDYEQWLFQERISASGYVRPEAENVLLKEATGLTGFSAAHLLRYRIQQSLKQHPLLQPGFMAALMIGDRSLVTDEHWALLTLTGTNHLMVISGLHIGLVAYLVFNLSFLVLRMIPGLVSCIPVSRLAATLALLGAFFYAALAGFSLPVQRALIMVYCLFSSHLLVRQVAPLNNLCSALLLVLLLDPLAPQSTGFWLSFGAVSVLMGFYLLVQKDTEYSFLKKIRALVQCQGFLFLGMMPIMLLFFGQVSLLAPVINIFAIPFVGLIIVPLCLLYLVVFLVAGSSFSLLLTLPDFLLSMFTLALDKISSAMSFSLIEFPTLPVWWLGALLASMVLMSLRSVLRSSLTGILLILLSFFYRTARPPPGEFTLDILDVGQGLATVVNTTNHLLIYDTGPGFSPRFNAGSGIVQPFLRQLNLGIPDVIVVSHGDNDHAGGLDTMSDSYPSARIIAGEQSAGSSVPAIPCIAGQQWRWDGIDFEFLHPFNGTASGNNASCVLKISSGAFSALLPGDIEQSAELLLLKNARENLSADILIAPHHGSLTSSIAPFLRAVSPVYGVFSAGYLNRFNHPHPDVKVRYQRMNIQMFNTSTSGTVRFRISASGLSSPVLFRQSHPRFWHLL